MRDATGWCLLIVAGTVIGPSDKSCAEDPARGALDFSIQLEVAQQALTPEFCWFHPRAAAIPGLGENGEPAVLMTIQKHLKVSDYYSGMWTMRTDDLGASWSGPTEIAELGWVRKDDGIVVAVADVTPGWHKATQRLLAIGCSVRYSPKGEQLADTQRPSQTAYAVHDPKTGRWSPWKTLEMPPDKKFDFARNGCSQWMVEPDGTVLVPIYFAESAGAPASVTVVRCRFDGEKLTYLEHGTELSLNVVRGLCEPSLVKFGNRYYMTIRNDLKGYVATSDDGLHFGTMKPWTFDDGAELGSYNTQQHWLVHSEGLFLAYTRRGADNDHIFRHRAPLFLAQVDPERLCVLRSTEKVLIPERGAQMGNFGASAISPAESWVTVSEYMADDKPAARGANGSTFVARVIWSKPNEVVE
jgi:hypothetical protein